MPHSLKTVSSEEAMTLVRIAIAHAAKNGWNVAVAVVDTQGALLAAQRMDGVAPSIMEFALDKAFTSATVGTSTEAFAERMASSPSLTMGLANRPRLIAWRGGLPIMSDETSIGGIAVSGAKDEEDIECAEAALVECGFSVA